MSISQVVVLNTRRSYIALVPCAECHYNLIHELSKKEHPEAYSPKALEAYSP